MRRTQRRVSVRKRINGRYQATVNLGGWTVYGEGSTPRSARCSLYENVVHYGGGGKGGSATWARKKFIAGRCRAKFAKGWPPIRGRNPANSEIDAYCKEMSSGRVNPLDAAELAILAVDPWFYEHSSKAKLREKVREVIASGRRRGCHRKARRLPRNPRYSKRRKARTSRQRRSGRRRR